MAIALIVAGVVTALAGWAGTGGDGVAIGLDINRSKWLKLIGPCNLVAACTCFYIAGIMAGAQ